MRYYDEAIEFCKQMVEWYKENNNDEQTTEYINELNYWQTVKTKLETIEKELQNK